MTIEATHELPHVNNLFAIAVRGESVAGTAATLHLGHEPFLSTLQKVFFFVRLQIFLHAGCNFLPLPPHAVND